MRARHGWPAAMLLGVVLCSSPSSRADSSGMISQAAATTDKNVAVLDSQLIDVSRRIDAMESRLFSVLLLAGGAFLSAVTAAAFSGMTHRQMRASNGGSAPKGAA